MSSKPEKSTLIEGTLSRLLSLLLLVVLLTLLGIAAWIGKESAMQFALSRLHHDAEAIISKLDVEQKKIIGSLSPIYRQPLSGHYYLVQFSDGKQLRSRSLWDEPFLAPTSSGKKAHYWLAAGPREQRLLMWQRTFTKDGQTFSITIAEDVAPLLAAVWRFIWIGVIASAAAVLLMLVAQQVLIRRTFARLDNVRDQVRAVREGQREELDTAVPGEIQPLVHEFNQLLRAWKQHQERSRNAAGNLAHALKTPLQLIKRYGDQHEEKTISEQARRMQSLIEQELKRARITGRASVGQHFTPEEDLKDLADTIRTLYHHKALQISTRIEAPHTLPLDQSDMLELVGNLLENAAKWAVKKIHLELTVNSRMNLLVEDDGPGIKTEKRKTLLQRGSRLDEKQPGHGLGLAIVQEIAALYGGSIELNQPSALGGLKVMVKLPVK